MDRVNRLPVKPFGRVTNAALLFSRLNLAKDAADMRESNDPDIKKDIYLNVSTVSSVM
jgi:hypothetical protein